ncbi:MAG: CapA family protein [Eubacteriales bacterium]
MMIKVKSLLLALLVSLHALPAACLPVGMPEERVSVVMVGDLLMHTFVQMSGHKPEGGYCFDHLFSHVRSGIKEADIAIINQETPLCGEAMGLSGYPCFNAPFEVADAIAGAGFTVVLQATNHTLDKGKEGVLACRRYWRQKHPNIYLVGSAGSAEEAAQVCVVERKGIRVAVLNYTYGTGGVPLPPDSPYLVRVLDEGTVRADVARAKELADFVILCPHWGTEYSHTPSNEQRRLCEVFLDCGVDLVIGTHPHVIQPVEWWESERGQRMLVYYSLGNFVNSASVFLPGVSNRSLGGMAKVSLVRGRDGRVRIETAGVIPLVTQLAGGYGGITVYPFSEYTETLAYSNHLLRARDPRFSYAYCLEHFRSVFGDFMLS